MIKFTYEIPFIIKFIVVHQENLLILCLTYDFLIILLSNFLSFILIICTYKIIEVN